MKSKRATDQLNVALSGLESAITLIASLHGQSPDGPMPKAINAAQQYADEVREHLLTIQFHIQQI